MKHSQAMTNIDGEYLVGVSLASVSKEGIPDRIFLTSPHSVITTDTDRVVAQLEFNTPDADVRADVENVLDLLTTAGLWLTISDTPEAIQGEVYMSQEATLKRVAVAEVRLTQLTYKLPLTEDGQVSYAVTFTYAPERPLHGLSLFAKRPLTLSRMEKLIPFIVGNHLGEVPVLVRYTTKNAIMHLTPNGLSDMIYIGDNHVWLISTADGRIGLDMERAKGEITITNSGYLLSIALKDHTLLEIFM